MKKEIISRAGGRTTGGLIKTGLMGTTAAMLLMSTTPASAQQTEMDALREQIAALQARLDKLEATSNTLTEANKAAPPATAKFPVTVSGLLQAHYLSFLNQSATVAAQPDTFRLRRGEIRITGNITPKISGTVMFDPAKNLAVTAGAVPAGGGTPAINVNQGSNLLQELQLSFLLNKTARMTHYADIGQFKIPVGYEGDQVSSSALQTVERALMFSQRDPFGGGYGDIRDTGAQLRGTVGQFDYRLGIFNGLGERQNALALDDPKAILARLNYRIAGVPGLQVGISGGLGNTKTATGAGILNRRRDRELFNTYVVYKTEPWTFQAEYLTGDSQIQGVAGVPPGGSALRRRNIQGYYGHVGYMFNPRLEGVLRYDYFNFDRRLNNANVNDTTLGLNYYLKGHNAKLQFDLVRRNGGSGLLPAFGFPGGAITNFSTNRTEIRTNIQVAF